jgi:hypothetical protein
MFGGLAILVLALGFYGWATEPDYVPAMFFCVIAAIIYMTGRAAREVLTGALR